MSSGLTTGLFNGSQRVKPVHGCIWMILAGSNGQLRVAGRKEQSKGVRVKKSLQGVIHLVAEHA